MRIVLCGISCVGKTTLGERLADIRDYTFVDFDNEVSLQMSTSISRLKDTSFNEYEYRQRVKHVLPSIFEKYSDDLVLAMPPSGLFREYKTVFDKHQDVITIWLQDSSKNILERLVFTDDDDNIIDEAIINDQNRHRYYDELKEDVAYYYDTLSKAHYRFNLNGLGIEAAAEALNDFIKNEIEKNIEAKLGEADYQAAHTEKRHDHQEMFDLVKASLND